MLTFARIVSRYKLPPRIGIHYSIGFITAFYLGIQVITGLILTTRMNFSSPWANYEQQKRFLISNSSFYLCQNIHMIGVTFVFVFL